MTRGLRWEMEGGLHHVTARAPKGLPVFRADEDRRTYLDLVAEEVENREWSLRTYCLMTTHIHLVVATPATDLGLGMKRIHERFARAMHKEYDGHGHVFGARFKNKPVLTPSHEVATLRYVARNPVAAGMCDSAADWEWSAHRALLGVCPAPDFLDVEAVLRVVDRDTYRYLTEATDSSLLRDLATAAPDTWVAEAVDEYSIPVATLAEHLGVHLTTLYKRLRAARATKGTGP